MSLSVANISIAGMDSHPTRVNPNRHAKSILLMVTKKPVDFQ
jgi:hypothetical protein